MLIFYQIPSDPQEIERLAQRHHQLNVKRKHYDLWLDALCEALAQHDPEFTAELEQKWRDAMRPGIAVMVAGLPTEPAS